MGKYMVLYHAPPEAMASTANMSEEEKMAGMKPWMEWMDRVSENLVDGGTPFMPGVIAGPDGNFKPEMNELTGYSIMQGDSIDQIKDMVKDHPHLKWTDGCKIEVKECVEMG